MRAFQIIAFVALVGVISCKDQPTKKDKRGILGLGYGAGLGYLGSGGPALSGGYEFASSQPGLSSDLALVGNSFALGGPAPSDSYFGGSTFAGSALTGSALAGQAFPLGSNSHTVTTVNRPVPVPVPQPYPVPVNRPVPVPVPQPVEIPVNRPYPVPVPQPYPVTVDRHIPVEVPRPVPVPQPVPVSVPQPFPVSVPQRIPVPISHPIPVGTSPVELSSGAAYGDLSFAPNLGLYSGLSSSSELPVSSGFGSNYGQSFGWNKKW